MEAWQGKPLTLPDEPTYRSASCMEPAAAAAERRADGGAAVLVYLLK